MRKILVAFAAAILGVLAFTAPAQAAVPAAPASCHSFCISLDVKPSPPPSGVYPLGQCVTITATLQTEQPGMFSLFTRSSPLDDQWDATTQGASVTVTRHKCFDTAGVYIYSAITCSPMVGQVSGNYPSADLAAFIHVANGSNPNEPVWNVCGF